MCAYSDYSEQRKQEIRQRARENTNRRTQERIAAGLCIGCGQVPPEPERRRCVPCAAKANTQAIKDQRKRKAAAKAEGCCTTCCNALAVEGKSTCAECLKQNALTAAERKTRGLCVKCAVRLEPGTRTIRCQQCQAHHCERERVRNRRNKRLAFDIYGGRCRCCGETNYDFLTIDHIHNDGNERRRAGLDSWGTKMYLLTIKIGTQDHLQLLCFNCNYGKRVAGGVCPHTLHDPRLSTEFDPALLVATSC